MLTHRYFYGINNNTIRFLYETLMSFKIFQCSFETFISSKISDIDICINRYVDNKDVFLSSLKELQNGSAHKKDYIKLYPDIKKGSSLMFNHRHKAKPSLPFIKLYDKETELLNKSSEFTETYLRNYKKEISNLTRIEVTIRNYAHRKRLSKYGILPMITTLNDLLQVSSNDMYNVIIFSVKSYINENKRITRADLSPSEHIIFELLQNCIHSGYSYNQLLNISSSFKSKNKNSQNVSQSRIRKQITTLYDLIIHKDLKIKSKSLHNNHIHEYLSFLKLNYK